MSPISCPICPKCGSKKFERLKGTPVQVKCKFCKKVVTL